MLNIDKLRADTPGCGNVLHFNNAGAALVTTTLLQTVNSYHDLEANIGGYEAAQISAAQADDIYKQAAQLIHCNPKEIAFVENATRAWDMIFYSLSFQKEDKIITSEAEYASNYLAFLHRAKQTGVTIEVVPNDVDGQLDCHDLQKRCDDKVKLIAITHVPTQGGLINPAQAVGKIANSFNIPYLLDTTQSIGQMPIDVNTIGCDFLCATGRKYLRGPRGTGFLYARQSRLNQCNPPFIDLHSAKWIADNDYVLRDDARRFETWEQNIAGKIGLGVAIKYALDLGLPAIWERIDFLAQQLRQKLAMIPSITLQDLGKNKCGIITFTCEKLTAQEVQQQLSIQKINVSVSLQEYARLDMAKRHLSAIVRASVHYYNTEDEIERFCAAIKQIIK